MEKETFGEYIRRLREAQDMPLRRLAALLDIDQSTLSKIETNQRQPTRDMVPVLAKVFKLDEKELSVKFLAERILYYVQDEENGLEALKLAEESIAYKKPAKKKSRS
ncbi:MAG: helix-turn-helix domain-containing protein [Bacteroidetes bacterium]|nr:helix-turn-helix domain-containing protein [Bacteroidota bacterium]